MGDSYVTANASQELVPTKGRSATVATSINTLVQFVRAHKPLCVITGAGCSTASGIFDYRDAVGHWKRPPPVMLDDFLTSAVARRRYWSRSMLGWRRFHNAKPNSAHQALVTFEQKGFVSTVIRQNVDDLHQSAGQKNIVSLHGSLKTVSCTDCGITISRQQIQTWLETSNPRFVRAAVSPDAGGEGYYDIDINDSFDVPICDACAGVLKSTFVFLGGNIPRSVKQAANAAVLASKGILVVGTSLKAYSSFRFIKEAHAHAIPIVTVGHGTTRGDALTVLKVRGDIGALFKELIASMMF